MTSLVKLENSVNSDLKLQEEITNELKWEPSIPSSNIGVVVHDGVVTLTGYVETFAHKWRIEEIVQRINGLKTIVIKIDVKLFPGTDRCDADIARSANNVLRWSNDLRNNSVTVMVESGWITLTGFVEWAYQKHNLAYAICNLMGVRGITNNLRLEPKLKKEVVKADIEKVLKHRALESIKNINIKVDGNEVHLTGSVNNWAEREIICYTTWNTPGVKNVINEIRIL